jgi:hypothetical protein
MASGDNRQNCQKFDCLAPGAEHVKPGGSVMVEVWMWVVGVALILCFLGWIKDSFF